jgi:hypothetical protein
MVTWPQNTESYRKRPQKLSKAIGHADLTLGATSQIINFGSALPTDAIILASWLDVTEGFSSTGTATSATKTGTNTETFSMTDGMTVILDVDGNGAETATFNFDAGTQEDTTYYPVSDQVGKQVNVAVDGGANQLVTFTSPCTTAAHVQAQMAGVTGVAISAASTAQAAQIPTNSVDATFNLIVDGDTAVIDVDNDAGGADTATWNIARASSTGAAATYAALNGKTLVYTIDAGIQRTITFTATEVDAATVNAKINSDMIGGSCVVNGTETDIFSDTYGTDSVLAIDATSTALAEIGHSAATNNGSGDAANGAATTIAEVKTFLEGDITGGSGITVTDIGSNRFSIVSNTTGATSELDVQSGTLLAKLGLTVAVVVGTADQVLLTSDTLGTGSSVSVTNVDSNLTWAAASDGTGDAVDSTAVTAAEVITVFGTDFTQGSTYDTIGGAVAITSGTSGITSELDFTGGTGLSVLGYSVETINGVDAVNGTATVGMGPVGGDADAIIALGNVSAAIGKINGPKGDYSDGHYGAETIGVKFTSNVNVTLLSTGALTAYVLYSDQTGYL